MQQLQNKITQAEKLNKQLTKVLSELQAKKQKNQKRQKQKNKKDQQLNLQQKSALDQANLKNVQRKIQLYKKELQNLQNVSGDHYLKKIKKSQQGIKGMDNKLDFYNKQIRKISDSLRPKRDKDQFSFQQHFSNYHTLQKRLNRLENRKNTTQKLRPIKKKWQEPENIIEPITTKKQIDRQAIYKNLIKFYQNEETTLKKSVKQMQQQKKQNDQYGQELDIQIKRLQKQIEQKRAQLKK